MKLDDLREFSYCGGLSPRGERRDQVQLLPELETQEGFTSLSWQGGGTCINEAALVAAGFEYKPIRSAEEMPECFSRPICSFVIEVNDQANDADRQRLLPYVTLLACADTPEIEAHRAAYIAQHTRYYLHHIPFEVGMKVLEGALAIGRQANEVAPDEVITRMEAVKQGNTVRDEARTATLT